MTALLSLAACLLLLFTFVFATFILLCKCCNYDEPALPIRLAITLAPEMTVSIRTRSMIAAVTELLFMANARYAQNAFTQQLHVLRVTGHELAHTFALTDTFGHADLLPSAMAADLATFFRLHAVFRRLLVAYVQHRVAQQSPTWKERLVDLFSECLATATTAQEASVIFAERAARDLVGIATSDEPLFSLAAMHRVRSSSELAADVADAVLLRSTLGHFALGFPAFSALEHTEQRALAASATLLVEAAFPTILGNAWACSVEVDTKKRSMDEVRYTLDTPLGAERLIKSIVELS